MKINDAKLEKLLADNSRQNMAFTLAQRGLIPSPPQLARLTEHLQTLDPVATPLRLGVIHTYTSELLDPWLAFAGALHQLAIEVYHAPYGVTIQEANSDSGLAAFDPRITLLLLRVEDLLPGADTPLSTLNADERKLRRDELVAGLGRLLAGLRPAVRGQIVISLLPEMDAPGAGLYDVMSEGSSAAWWQELYTQLARDVTASFNGISVLDMRELVAATGRTAFFDKRLWYTATFPFASAGALALADALAHLGASLVLSKAKLIVLDADNTLWGGVVGEDGTDGIALGPEYPGRAYVDFQRRLLDLQQRGFILALCSKNNPDDALAVLESHPHQLLRPQHFAALRINWQPKPDNLRALAEELNLGLDSFVFVDDSDHECSAVRHALPEVTVVQVPATPAQIPTCLDHLARLEITALTAEDVVKTTQYAQERQRKAHMVQVTGASGSVDDYLKSLNMHMAIYRDDVSQLPRLAQLTQKTNQFNLTTRRYSEQDMATRLADAATRVYSFSLADNFGDSGVVGLAIIEAVNGKEARLDTFLMSCRVIGRRAERAFLGSIAQDLINQAVSVLRAEFISTRKNPPAADFLAENGFTVQADGTWLASLDDPALPNTATLPIQITGPAT